MKIPFEALESIVISAAKAPRIFESYRANLFEEAYPLLYVAAQCGEIELIDALIACRHNADLTQLLARTFVTVRDIDDVKTVLSLMQLDVPEFVNRCSDNYVLEDWLKKYAG